MSDASNYLILAEDNDDDAFLTTRALQEAGIFHVVERCRDGQAVIERLQQALSARAGTRNAFPDLILLDLKMPRLGGLDTLRWIRSHETLAALAVIALTSSTEPRDVATAYRLHINAYLVKPSSLREMVALARSLRAFWLEEKHFILPPTGIDSTRPVP